MGIICEKQKQLNPQSTINDKIILLIKQEAIKSNKSCNWSHQLLKNIGNISQSQLFQEIYINETQKFIKDNIDRQVSSSIRLNEQRKKFEKQMQESSLVIEDQLSMPLTSPTKRQLRQTESSLLYKEQINKSIIIQMDLIFRTQFLQEKQYYCCAKKFIKWIVLVQSHFKKKFLRFLYQTFYVSIQNQMDRIKNEQLIMVLDNITFEINKFISMMTVVYTQVYFLKQIQAQFNGHLFKIENIYNFIMKLIFNYKSLSKKIFDIIRSKIVQKISFFKKKLQFLDKQSIYSFQIPKQFLLIDRHPSNTQKRILNQHKEIMYSECIQKICKIKQTSTPIQKLKIIILVSKLIKETIQTYYQKKKSLVPELDSEVMSSILIYIIVKSEYSEILVDLEIIENFTSRNCLNCVSAYYLNLFKACIQMIMARE